MDLLVEPGICRHQTWGLIKYGTTASAYLANNNQSHHQDQIHHWRITALGAYPVQTKTQLLEFWDKAILPGLDRTTRKTRGRQASSETKSNASCSRLDASTPLWDLSWSFWPSICVNAPPAPRTFFFCYNSCIDTIQERLSDGSIGSLAVELDFHGFEPGLECGIAHRRCGQGNKGFTKTSRVRSIIAVVLHYGDGVCFFSSS